MKKTQKRKRRTIEIVRSTYQPTKAELEADIRIDATPEEIARSLCQPVKISYIDKPKAR